jgi:hypothetical protein
MDHVMVCRPFHLQLEKSLDFVKGSQLGKQA